MLNRLAEIQGLNADSTLGERPLTARLGEDGVTEKFFPVIDKLRADLKDLEGSVRQMTQFSKDLLECLDNDEDKRINKEAQTLIASFMGRVKSIQSELTQLREDNTKFESKHGKERDTEVRIRTGMWTTVFERLQEVNDAFSRERDAFQFEAQSRTRRYILTVYPEMSEEEASELVTLGCDVALVQERMRKGMVKKEQAFQDLKETLGQVKLLEQSVKEVHSNIAALSTLVKTQDEAIKVVESNIQNTTDFVDRAKEDLEKTMLYKRKRDRNRIIFYTICVFLVFFLYWYVFGTPWEDEEKCYRLNANVFKTACVPAGIILTDPQIAALKDGKTVKEVYRMEAATAYYANYSPEKVQQLLKEKERRENKSILSTLFFWRQEEDPKASDFDPNHGDEPLDEPELDGTVSAVGDAGMDEEPAAAVAPRSSLRASGGPRPVGAGPRPVAGSLAEITAEEVPGVNADGSVVMLEELNRPPAEVLAMMERYQNRKTEASAFKQDSEHSVISMLQRSKEERRSKKAAVPQYNLKAE